MSTKVFNTEYADQYDLLYGEKDYEAECDLLEQIFRLHFAGKVKSILDLGCGTGNHVLPLTKRGYELTGVDVSDEMLVHARQKAAGLAGKGKDPVFYNQDLRHFQLDEKFDVVLMMFAVLGYQLENKDVAQAVETARRHLNPGGLFIFDVWYGPAVLAIRPSDRIKVIESDGDQLIRAASGSLNIFDQSAEVRYHIWRIREKQVINETIEDHRMRYFFPQELTQFLDQAGLELVSLTEFPTLDRLASEASWNVLGISMVAA